MKSFKASAVTFHTQTHTHTHTHTHALDRSLSSAAVPKGNGTGSQQEGQIHRWSRTVASCHLKTSEQRQPRTGVRRSMTRGLQPHHVGHGDVLFLRTHLTEWKGHSEPKIQTHGSRCGRARPEETHCVKEKYRRRKTPRTMFQHTVTQAAHTWTLSVCVWECVSTASTWSLFSLHWACGRFLHRSNPFIQTLWRLTVPLISVKARLIATTARTHLLENYRGERKERVMEGTKKEGRTERV